MREDAFNFFWDAEAGLHAARVVAACYDARPLLVWDALQQEHVANKGKIKDS